jgi:glycosyltransferase involved in cell wall biosynthesis
LVSGERIRNFYLLRELAARGWRLRLFSLVHGARPAPAELGALEGICDEVILEPFERSRLGRYARLARSLAVRRAFHVDFFCSRTASARLRDPLRLSSSDVVVAGQLYMYPYVGRELHRRTVLDALNVEVRRVRAMSAALGLSPRGLAARLQAGPVGAYEAEAVKAVARIVAVSAEEAAHFEQLAPGRVALVPNGVDCERLQPRPDLPPEPRLLLHGSMDYSAHVDAVTYFVDEVLPGLRRRDASVTVVGSNPRPAVYEAARRSPRRVEVAGHVEDTRPYFERSRVLVVPLRYGGGTRLKILEALAQGVPVVSTTIGCEGLDLRDGRELLRADGPQELAAAVERLLEDDELCLRLARAGREAVERRYDWRALGEEFARVLRGVADGG